MFCENRQCCYSILAIFIQCFCIVHLQCHFGEPLCLFFFFFFLTVATVPRGAVAIVAIYIYIFFSVFRLYFFFPFYIYCYDDTINFIIFSQLLRCQFHYHFSVLALFIQCFCTVHLQSHFGEPLCPFLFFFYFFKTFEQ